MLRPQDAGVLASVGVAAVAVVRRPSVRVLITGDELDPPGSTPGGSTLSAHAAVLAAGLVVGAVTEVRASEYPGWGDTGWVYASKRECCNGAIAIASQYSEQACVNAGGRPSPFQGGGQRGSCSSQLAQAGDGNTMYRCYGEAAVWCD